MYMHIRLGRLRYLITYFSFAAKLNKFFIRRRCIQK